MGVWIVVLLIIFYYYKILFLKTSNRYWTIFLAAAMFILFIGNYENADYAVYKDYYDYVLDVDTWGLEILFEQMMKLIKFLGLSYQGFLIVVAVCIFPLLWKSISEYTNNIELVLLFYLIYPLLMNTIQLRNFIASIIILFAIRYLLEKKLIKYVTLIIIAGLFHKFAFVGLLYIFIHKVKLKHLVQIVLVTVPISFIAYFFNVFPFLLRGFLPEEKINTYFYPEEIMGMGYFAFTGLLHIIPLFIIFMSNRIIDFSNNSLINYQLKVNNTKSLFRKIKYENLRWSCLIAKAKEVLQSLNRIESKNTVFNNFVLKLNVFYLSIVPFYFYTNSFERFPRNIMLLNFILFANLFHKINNQVGRILFLTFIIIYVILCALIFTVPYIIPVLTKNWILGG